MFMPRAPGQTAGRENTPPLACANGRQRFQDSPAPPPLVEQPNPRIAGSRFCGDYPCAGFCGTFPPACNAPQFSPTAPGRPLDHSPRCSAVSSPCRRLSIRVPDELVAQLAAMAVEGQFKSTNELIISIVKAVLEDDRDAHTKQQQQPTPKKHHRGIITPANSRAAAG
jgi:Arc/MetJ-type ribon-helix-helix transcriptional regulator